MIDAFNKQHTILLLVYTMKLITFYVAIISQHAEHSETSKDVVKPAAFLEDQ